MAGKESLFSLIGEAVMNRLNASNAKNKTHQGWFNSPNPREAAGETGQMFPQGMVEPGPGYTPNQMRTNQFPMGVPSQDPAQFDIPYRQPYGPRQVISQDWAVNPMDIAHSLFLNFPYGRGGDARTMDDVLLARSREIGIEPFSDYTAREAIDAAHDRTANKGNWNWQYDRSREAQRLYAQKLAEEELIQAAGNRGAEKSGRY